MFAMIFVPYSVSGLVAVFAVCRRRSKVYILDASNVIFLEMYSRFIDLIRSTVYCDAPFSVAWWPSFWERAAHVLSVAAFMFLSAREIWNSITSVPAHCSFTFT